jgi:hypothetical protein
MWWKAKNTCGAPAARANANRFATAVTTVSEIMAVAPAPPSPAPHFIDVVEGETYAW